MFRSHPTRGLRVLGALLALLAWAVAAWAADHKDSPAVEADPATDINDVYAFRNGDNLVIAMTVQSFRLSGGATDLFNPRARYQFFVDNNNDGQLRADATITVTFSATAPQRFTVSGLTSTPIQGDVAGFGSNAFTTSGGIRVYAGSRDDPFFFDLAGFRAFLAGSYTPTAGLRNGSTPLDAFRDLNVAAIVIELPIVAVTGLSNPNAGVIRAWAATSVLQ